MKLPFRQNRAKEPMRTPHTEDQSAYAFRRSRTITGAVSNDIRVAGEQNAQLRSERLKTHDLKTHRRKIGWVLLMCLVCALVLYALLSQSIFSVAVSSPDPSKQADYTRTMNDYFASRPSERLLFALQPDTLSKYFQQHHREVLSVSLVPTGFLRPADVRVSLRRPVASWLIGGKQYYIDSSGVAYEHMVGELPALVVEDKSGIDPNSTSAVAPERMIRYVGRLVAILAENGLKVERLELPLLTSRQIDVYLEGRGYAIKTSIDRDPAGQVADIVNMLTYLDRHQIVPESHVDARVSSRAFYR